MRPRISRACASNRVPAVVGVTPRDVLCSSTTPRSSSKLRIKRLSAGWATCSAAAARLIEPVDTTATKHCIARIDIDMRGPDQGWL
ncbi:hypothetical protein D3C73_1515460 [compost metagenome]